MRCTLLVGHGLVSDLPAMLICITAFRAVVFYCIVARTACEENRTDLDAEEDGFGWRHGPDPDEKEAMTAKELHEAHASVDANGDKQVSRQELLDFVEEHQRDVALTHMDPAGVLEEKDESKDGRVNLEEYLDEFKDSVEPNAGNADGNWDPKHAEETAKFKAADANDDGSLDKSELAAIISPETHAPVMKVILNHSMIGADIDGNGGLSLEEFRKSDLAMEADFAFDDGEAHSEHFGKLDRNGDGAIDMDELHNLKSGKVQRQSMVNRFFNSADKDGDGHVDTKELALGATLVYDSQLQHYLTAWAKRRQVVAR